MAPHRHVCTIAKLALLSWLFAFRLTTAREHTFAPTSMHDWIWWKLGFLPEWGKDSISIETSFGRMQARTFGTRGDRVVVTIHGGMDAVQIHHEMDNVSMQLADQGFFVVAPNFHSTRRTRPGKLTSPELVTLLGEIAKWAGCKRLTMVQGKGWGAALAARASVVDPKVMRKLVMIAPGGLRGDYSNEKNLTITVDSLLLYAVDDSSIDILKMHAIRHNAPNMMSGWGIHKGGHKMLPSFYEDILRFANLRGRRSDDDDDEEEEEALATSHSEEL